MSAIAAPPSSGSPPDDDNDADLDDDTEVGARPSRADVTSDSRSDVTRAAPDAPVDFDPGDPAAMITGPSADDPAAAVELVAEASIADAAGAAALLGSSAVSPSPAVPNPARIADADERAATATPAGDGLRAAATVDDTARAAAHVDDTARAAAHVDDPAPAAAPTAPTPTPLAAVAAVAEVPVNKWLVAVSIAFGSLMATIDSSIVNVALPNIRGELGASIQEITWISTAYMIAMVLVMPLTGFLGGFFGQKRVYLASMVLFVAGSALCGTAHSLSALVFYRILQGLGGGALQPTQQAILRQTFPPHEAGMAMAMFSMVIMIGPAIGPVLGGFITDNYAWPWIFYINLPVGIVGIMMTVRNVREPDDVRIANRARAELARKNLDIAGIIFMVVGIAALQYMFEEGPQDDWFASLNIRIALFTTVVALSAFVIRELTATAPVVNLRLFKDATFASATVIAFIMFGMLMGSMFLLPVFAQESLHYTATLSGIVLMPRTLAMMAMSPFIGRIYNKVQPAFIVAFGVILFMIGSYTLSHISLDTGSRDLVIPLIITGAAFACLFVPLTTAALSRIPRHQMADAAGLNSFIRQVGGSIGLTIFATMFTNYAIEARASLASHVTTLRPEVVSQIGAIKSFLVGHGFDPNNAQLVVGRMIGGRMMAQAGVLSINRIFLLQGVLFLAVIPLLFFLRVPRDAAPVHVEISAE